MSISHIIHFKDSELVYSRSSKIIRQQTYRGSSYNVGWMRGMLVYNNSLSMTNFENLKYTIYVFNVTYYSELHIAKAFAKNEFF